MENDTEKDDVEEVLKKTLEQQKKAYVNLWIAFWILVAGCLFSSIYLIGDIKEHVKESKWERLQYSGPVEFVNSRGQFIEIDNDGTQKGIRIAEMIVKKIPRYDNEWKRTQKQLSFSPDSTDFVFVNVTFSGTVSFQKIDFCKKGMRYETESMDFYDFDSLKTKDENMTEFLFRVNRLTH